MGKELITEELKKQIAPLFRKMKKKVLLTVILDGETEVSAELSNFVKEIASVSEHFEVRFLKMGEDAAVEKELHAEHLPVTGIYSEDGVYSGACFHGVPGGKEINSFIAAICNFGGAGQKLDRRLKKEIEKIHVLSEIKIFVSLACHHCPHVVAACQKLAIASPYVTADMYDARLYPDLIEKYKIERVPMTVMTVVEDSQVLMGQKTIEDIVKSLTIVKSE